MLLGGEQGEAYTKASAKEEVRKPFNLPPKNNEMRRIFAYLMKHRHIDRDVISFFAREKLIYESIEQSADKTKKYHNAIFVGYDETGIPRHAHKKGIYTEGKGFKGNIDSSNPCYSFHYLGSSDRIYVFEAPVDMLSFITIHKNSGWKKHSYVALCGVSEQALFKMLEINPNLAHAVLCLDYDPAGIEACEKIADMLIEKNIACSRLKSNKKDWNEDLKAIQNMPFIPAEEHPQYMLRDEMCKEILMLVKGLERSETNRSDGDKAIKEAQQQAGSQAEAIKTASAIFLRLSLKERRQLGNVMTAEDIVKKMRTEFRAYQNRGRRNPTLSDIEAQLSALAHKSGIIPESEKTATAEHYEKVALELLKSAIRLELTQQKQIQAPILKMA